MHCCYVIQSGFTLCWNPAHTPDILELCRDYFAFEFLQKSSRFTRHVVAVATVANGKLILFTTGAKEGARWEKMKDKLTKSVQSFKAFNVYK